MRKVWPQLLLPLAILSVPTPAAAAAWSSDPITLVVPFAAGGALDVVSRVVATRLDSVQRRAGASLSTTGLAREVRSG